MTATVTHLQIAGGILGLLWSMIVLLSSTIVRRKTTVLANWQAYSVAFTVRLIGFLVMAIGLVVIPLDLLGREQKIEFFTGFILVLFLSFFVDVIWSLIKLRKT